MYEISARRPRYSMRPFNPFDMFDEFDRQMCPTRRPKMSPLPFRTDILDQGDKVVISSEMPGIEKEDIHVDVEGDMLTISVEHDEKTEDKDESGSYILKERHFHSCKRSFDISNIDSDKIEAKYENGVLVLEMPKKVDEIPASKRLQIA